MRKPYCSRIADDVLMGENVEIYGFVNLYGCTIGAGCRIGAFVEIQKQVTVGERVKIQSHTFICSGVTIEDEVFVGHGVMFINDLVPRATKEGRLQGEADWNCLETHIGRRVAIGSNATILGGLTIGEGAVIGAGSVITRDVPPYTIVAGNPGRILRSVRRHKL